MITRDELINDILDVLAEEGQNLSATAISKAVGYTKLSPRVFDILQDLVEANEIEKETHQNGFDVYSIIPEEEEDGRDNYEEDEEEEDEEEDEEDEDNNVMPREILTRKIPENNNGYEIEALPKDHTKVIFPEKDENGNEKSTILEPTEQLVVINQNPIFRFVVTKPDEILEAISIFTTELGISTYLVTDTSTQKSVSNVAELDPSVVVIFLNIQRHDKAGR